MLALPETFTRRLITVVAVAMSVFHLWVAFVGPPDAYVMRGSHLAFALVLAFLIMPGVRGRATPRRLDRRAAGAGGGGRDDVPEREPRLHPEPHLLRRRSAPGRLRLRRRADPAADGGHAALHRLGAAGDGDGLPRLRPDARRPVGRHHARPALPHDRRHLRHPALRLGDVRDALHPLRLVRREERRRPALHGLRARPGGAHLRRAGQGGGHHQQPLRHGLRAARWPTS